VEQLVEAEEAFALWGLRLAPGYFAGAVTQEGIRRWYETVADQSPIPIMMFVVLIFSGCFVKDYTSPLRVLLLMNI
jgi:dihydrodipicolinate synthase/N-acetylneuraminate lyase